MELLAEKWPVGWRCTHRDRATRLSCNTSIAGPNDVRGHMESQHGIPRDQIIFDDAGDVYRAQEAVTPEKAQEVGAI